MKIGGIFATCLSLASGMDNAWDDESLSLLQLRHVLNVTEDVGVPCPDECRKVVKELTAKCNENKKGCDDDCFRAMSSGHGTNRYGGYVPFTEYSGSWDPEGKKCLNIGVGGTLDQVLHHHTGISVMSYAGDAFQWQVYQCPKMNTWGRPSYVPLWRTIAHAFKIGEDLIHIALPQKFNEGGCNRGACGFIPEGNSNGLWKDYSLVVHVNGEPFVKNPQLWRTGMLMETPGGTTVLLKHENGRFLMVYNKERTLKIDVHVDHSGGIPALRGHLLVNHAYFPVTYGAGDTTQMGITDDYEVLCKGRPYGSTTTIAGSNCDPNMNHHVHNWHDGPRTKGVYHANFVQNGGYVFGPDQDWQDPGHEFGSLRTINGMANPSEPSLFSEEFVRGTCQFCDSPAVFPGFDRRNNKPYNVPLFDASKGEHACAGEDMVWTTTTTTTTTTTITTTLYDPCDSNPVLQLKAPTRSNLASKGPDSGPRGVLYPEAGVIDGKTVDVKMNAIGSYVPHKNSLNGVSGSLGAVNLKVGTTSAFEFSLVESGTDNPVAVQGMSITFLDLDEGKRGKGRATVSSCESTVSVSSKSELTVKHDGGCASVSSSKRGSAKDNPTSTSSLTDVQLAKTATFNYGSGSKFRATLTLAPKGKSGRNFMFALEPTICSSP